MKRAEDKIHGIPSLIANMIKDGKPLRFVLEFRGKVYERTFIPSGISLDRSIVSYRHLKTTYNLIEVPGGRIQKFVDRIDMPEDSTIQNHIYRTIRILLLEGYKFTTESQSERRVR